MIKRHSKAIRDDTRTKACRGSGSASTGGNSWCCGPRRPQGGGQLGDCGPDPAMPQIAKAEK